MPRSPPCWIHISLSAHSSKQKMLKLTPLSGFPTKRGGRRRSVNYCPLLEGKDIPTLLTTCRLSLFSGWASRTYLQISVMELNWVWQACTKKLISDNKNLTFHSKESGGKCTGKSRATTAKLFVGSSYKRVGMIAKQQASDSFENLVQSNQDEISRNRSAGNKLIRELS